MTISNLFFLSKYGDFGAFFLPQKKPLCPLHQDLLLLLLPRCKIQPPKKTLVGVVLGRWYKPKPKVLTNSDFGAFVFPWQTNPLYHWQLILLLLSSRCEIQPPKKETKLLMHTRQIKGLGGGVSPSQKTVTIDDFGAFFSPQKNPLFGLGVGGRGSRVASTHVHQVIA